jgi:ABC-type lipoprotein export system ATPase subunit
MLRPTAGKVRLDGTDLYHLAPGPRAAFRARHIGFVFQMFHLVPYLDLVGNVFLGGGRLEAAREEADALLARVGLAARAHHRPAELSAGERQRVAVARALLPSPSVILADEPTGNLDPENASVVLELLSDFHAQGGTVLLVTHGAGPTVHADRVLRIEAGKMVE